MKYEFVGTDNGIEMYSPIAESRIEEIELAVKKDRFINLMVEIILKYYPKVEQKIEKLDINNLESVDL